MQSGKIYSKSQYVKKKDNGFVIRQLQPLNFIIAKVITIFSVDLIVWMFK